jgi:hypothetical protein
MQMIFSRHSVYPCAASPANCFAVRISIKQTLKIGQISLPRRSGHLIEIMDFISPLFVNFLSPIKLLLGSLDRAAGCGAERRPPPSRRYRTALKRPPSSPQPKRQSLSPVRDSLNGVIRGAIFRSYGLDGSILKEQSI